MWCNTQVLCHCCPCSVLRASEPRLPPSRPPAVADVWQLLPAKAELIAQLGPAAAARAAALSCAYSEWLLDPADRSCPAPSGSYAAAVQLPLGKDMELSMKPPHYRPE